MPDTPLDTWNHALARLLSWDYQQDPSPLITDLAALPQIRQALAPSVHQLRSLIARYLQPTYCNPLYEDAAHPLFGLLAAQGKHQWPWDDPDARIRELWQADNDAALAMGLRWARLAKTAATAMAVSMDKQHPDQSDVVKQSEPTTAAPVAWLETAITLRHRPLWLPAAVAIGELCVGALADTAWARRWEASCADKSAPTAPIVGVPPVTRRHRLAVAVIATTSRSGPFAGKHLAAWLSEINDIDDASSVSSALLYHGQTTAAAEQLLAAEKRFRPLLSYQVWDEARRLLVAPYAAHLTDGAREGLTSMLLDGPTGGPATGGAMLEELVDAGVTLVWLRDHGMHHLEPRLRQGRLARAPELVEAVDARGKDWTARVRGALRRLHPDQVQATPLRSRPAAFAEAFTLLSSPEGTGVSWRAVAGPVLQMPRPNDHGGHRQPSCQLLVSEGLVEDVAWIDLGLLAVANDLMFRSAAHKFDLDPQLAVQPNGPEGRLVTHRHQSTRGFQHLVAARWRRGERAGNACWTARPDITLTIASHIVRRVMRAPDPASSERVLDEVILRMCAEDAPTYDVWSVRLSSTRADDERLWTNVQRYLPMTALGERLRRRIDPIRAMESARYRGDHALMWQNFEEVFRSSTFCTLLADLRSCHQAAVTAAKSGEQVLHANWERGPTAASPQALQLWWRSSIEPLGEQLLQSSTKIADELHDPTGRPEPANLAIIRAVSKLGMPSVSAPMAGEELSTTYRTAIEVLHELARLQPWHIRHEVGNSIRIVEQWLPVATRNDARRDHLTDALQRAMSEGDEEFIRGVLASEEGHLLDAPFLRSIGQYFLDRLNFDGARALPAHARVPNPFIHFWPLLSAIVGGPVAALQSNYFWEPLLEAVDAKPWKYGIVVVIFYAACTAAFLGEARGRMPEMAWATFLRRCASPLTIIFAGNLTINVLVFQVAGRANQPYLPTILLWSSLSMYLGVFFGLLAQDRHLSRATDS
jgi:hypothetical protein